MPAKKHHAVLVIACDPGNESTGIAIFKIYDNIVYETSSATIHIWEPGVEQRIDDLMLLASQHAYVYQPSHTYFCYEQPVNGTHVSRAGVARATGHVIGLIAPYVRLKRANTYAIPVPCWRDATYPGTYSTDGYKKAALDKAAKAGVAVASHDEAEARLIGLYFCHKLINGDLTFRVKRSTCKKSRKRRKLRPRSKLQGISSKR